jgi:predicted RNA-binding protein with PIN domain
MPYLIDGHNLIPRLGINLSEADDEMQLVSLLQEFCRLSRKQAHIYFDDAPPGQPATRKYGAVTAHFVRASAEADDAIATRLSQLGGDARNWAVVSSDHRVQAEGRAAGAKVITSEAFSRQLRDTLAARSGPSGSAGEMSEAELAEWLEIFKIK